MGTFKTVGKALELLEPGGTLAELSPSGSGLIRAEVKRLRVIETAARDYVAEHGTGQARFRLDELRDALGL